MKFIIKSSEKSKRSPELTAKLLSVWEASVRASHHFLTKTDITRLAPQAEEALRQIETLWIVEDGQHPVGFMGVQERKIESSFSIPTISARDWAKSSREGRLTNWALNS